LAGSGAGGFRDGVGTEAKFYYPGGLGIDGEGNVYVAGNHNHRIRRVTPAGVVTTLAGSAHAGYRDGGVLLAEFHNPVDVTVDGAGSLYVVDHHNHRVRKLSGGSLGVAPRQSTSPKARRGRDT